MIKSNFSKKAMSNFSWIPLNILNDPNLSFRAKALWTYMNGKPETWNFSAVGICSQTKEGRDAVLTAMNELINAGLLESQRESNGHISYCLLSKDKPKPDNPTVENNHSGERRSHSNKEIEAIKNRSNKESSMNEDIDFIFNEFHNLFGYPPKKSKQERFAIYNLLQAKDKGRNWLLKMMKVWYASRSDRYSPRISCFCDFQQKYPALLEWAQRKYGQTINHNNINFDLNKL